MKQNFALPIFLSIIVLFVFSYNNALAFSGAGAGTEEDPYVITICAELAEIDDDLSSYYVLGNDVDCDGVDFQPIGTYDTNPFTGTLDGQDFSIQNLVIDQTGVENVGLFSYIDGGVVKNLTLESGSVTSDSNYVGGIAAYVDGGVSLVNVTSNLTINIGSEETPAGDAYYIGGLIGYSNDVLNLINSNFGGDLNIYSTGEASLIGGLVGFMVSNVTIENSNVLGDILVTSTTSNVAYIGGLLGDVEGGLSISDSEFIGSLNLTGENTVSSVGGLAGYVSTNATINASSVEGDVYLSSGTFYVQEFGGLVAHVGATLNINDSHYLGGGWLDRVRPQ
jgi:hypothetical protein